MLDFEEEEKTLSDDMFNVDYIHIEDVVNKVVIYKGVMHKQTTNGDRILVAVDVDDTSTAFITGSKWLTDTLSNRSKDQWPFRAIMKVVAYGMMTGFKLFSPNCNVTQEDVRLLNQYKKGKFIR